MIKTSFVFKVFFVCFISFFNLQSLVFAAESGRGQKLYQTCVACHGANAEGGLLVNAPQLAGQHAWYIESQLKKFKDGIRGAHADDVEGLKMRPMAKALKSDEDIKLVAEYVSQLKPQPRTNTFKDANATAGQGAYMVCMTCHGDKAQGNEALKAPALKVLSDWYIMAQIKKYQLGIRGTNPQDIEGMQMKPMASTLVNDQAIKDVTAYINSL